ncbi:MAG TPA: hypothetical protein VI485_16020 [Vicinamibacterales bacterium]|nr:hypothetical protein [Vicinamibacterales bacterium]
MSYPLLEEVLGLLEFDAAKYHRVMGLLLDASQFNLLRATDELGEAEVTNGSLRGQSERLEWFGTAVTVRRALRKGHGLEQIPRLTQAVFAQFEADENDRRDDIRNRLAEMADIRPLERTRQWWRNAEAQVDDWVSDHMANNRERLGLSADRAHWPAPSTLQTIWHFYAYRMARIHLNVGENRRVRGSDCYDAHHYAAAASMDIMVSDDGDLRATAAVIPNPPFRLLTFEEFVNELGVAHV